MFVIETQAAEWFLNLFLLHRFGNLIFFTNIFFRIDRVVMTVYFTNIFEGYHLKIKLLKKSCNFHFPAKCNNWGRSIKIHDKIVKLVHNAQKNRYIRTHFSFFLATPYLLSYPLQSFGGKFKIANFYKQLDFNMVPLKFVCKIHRHYYSNNNI